jgi:hypothetical protein
MSDKTREDFGHWWQMVGAALCGVTYDQPNYQVTYAQRGWNAGYRVATQHSAARIAELEAEVQALRRDVEHKDAFAEQIGRDLSKADAECRALRRDAERYRWLRDASVPPHNFYISVPDEFHGVRYQSSEVDAYIDAAIEAERAKT